MSKINKKKTEQYQGFEQGPIRPPSEAASLLIRVTRNCPWNKCTFCPIYKKKHFSLRYVSHIKKDIDIVHQFMKALTDVSGNTGQLTQKQVAKFLNKIKPDEEEAFYAALNWLANGMESVFIQDANSLIIKPENLVEILSHLKACFPYIKRITSYARSHTIARIKDDDLNAIKQAGLNRIHIGMESGSDHVLKMVKKGTTKAQHIKAGLKVKKAGMELSEYVMPGLGGLEFSEIHAKETADALNQINPDFIRLRSLAIPHKIPLWEDYQKGIFKKCTDIMTAREILLFLESLTGITSIIKSDHILNLFEEIEGKLPEDQIKMTGIIHDFLNLNPKQQTIYQVGRRLGVFRGLTDMENPYKLARAKETCNSLSITPDNVDEVIDRVMRRFV
ncbi:Radical SAM protein [Candidatus Magnetomoraceae bacterium gMMP-1]